MRTATHRLFAYLICSVLAACNGSKSNNVALPALPRAAPSPAGSLTVNGFPVRIQEYTVPNGGPRFPVVGADGAIWFSAGALQMDRVTGPGTVTVFTAPSSPPGNPEGVWTGFGLSAAHAGNVYTTFTGVGGPWGNFPSAVGLARVTTSGYISPAAVIGYDNIAAPSVQMTTDSSGETLWIYENDYNGSGRLLCMGRCIATSFFDSSLSGDAEGLAYGPDSNLYAAANAAATPTIYKISPAFRILTSFRPPATAPFGSMVFGSDGALWILEPGTDIIAHLTTSGVYKEYRVPFPHSNPTAITKGSDGAIWFTDSGTNAVGRVTSSGDFNEFPVATPNAFGGYGVGIVSCPQKCDGAHGRLWFTETTPSRVGKLEF